MKDRVLEHSPPVDDRLRRIIASVIGVIIIGISIGFSKYAAFGVNPFQVLVGGCHEISSLQFGTVYAFVNAGLLLFMLLTDKHYIGFATVFNLLFLGYITQFTLFLLNTLFPTAYIPLRILAFVISITLLCLGASIMMVADIGISPCDAVSLILTYKWKMGQFKYVRMAVDFIYVFSGTLILIVAGKNFGEIIEIVGIGTIVTAFFTGPLIEFFRLRVSEPMIKCGQSESNGE